MSTVQPNKKVPDFRAKQEWRKVKVDGHVEEVLAAVRELNRQ